MTIEPRNVSVMLTMTTDVPLEQLRDAKWWERNLNVGVVVQNVLEDPEDAGNGRRKHVEDLPAVQVNQASADVHN